MEKLDIEIKLSKIAVIISCIGIVIAVINLIYSAVNGLPIWTAVALVCCNLSIMCVCSASLSRKKRQHEVKKDDGAN